MDKHFLKHTVISQAFWLTVIVSTIYKCKIKSCYFDLLHISMFRKKNTEYAQRTTCRTCLWSSCPSEQRTQKQTNWQYLQGLHATCQLKHHMTDHCSLIWIFMFSDTHAVLLEQMFESQQQQSALWSHLVCHSSVHLQPDKKQVTICQIIDKAHLYLTELQLFGNKLVSVTYWRIQHLYLMKRRNIITDIQLCNKINKINFITILQLTTRHCSVHFKNAIMPCISSHWLNQITRKHSRQSANYDF